MKPKGEHDTATKWPVIFSSLEKRGSVVSDVSLAQKSSNRFCPHFQLPPPFQTLCDVSHDVGVAPEFWRKTGLTTLENGSDDFCTRLTSLTTRIFPSIK